MLVAAPGDYGKPRPALVVQSDSVNPTHPSVAVCLVTSELRQTPLFRIGVEPDSGNGLQKPSQVMVDKIVTIAQGKIAARIGALSAAKMREFDRAFAAFYGIAD